MHHSLLDKLYRKRFVSAGRVKKTVYRNQGNMFAMRSHISSTNSAPPCRTCFPNTDFPAFVCCFCHLKIELCQQELHCDARRRVEELKIQKNFSFDIFELLSLKLSSLQPKTFESFSCKIYSITMLTNYRSFIFLLAQASWDYVD